MSESPNKLRVLLASRDVACPSCGYNLRGLTGLVCPECGEPPVFRRPWWDFRGIEWAFVWGAAISLLAILVLVAAIFWAASDPLWVIALWVPVAMMLPWMVVTSVWTGWLIHAGRRRAWVAIANAMIAWAMAAAYGLFVGACLVRLSAS